MDISTRTTEGFPCRCPVCGKEMSITPSEPLGDATCPHCGVLLYLDSLGGRPIPDDLKTRLAELGVVAETDDQGEVVRVQLVGPRYNDHTIHKLARLKGIPIIDIRGTEISQRGAELLRELLPDAIVES